MTADPISGCPSSTRRRPGGPSRAPPVGTARNRRRRTRALIGSGADALRTPWGSGTDSAKRSANGTHGDGRTRDDRLACCRIAAPRRQTARCLSRRRGAAGRPRPVPAAAPRPRPGSATRPRRARPAGGGAAGVHTRSRRRRGPSAGSGGSGDQDARSSTECSCPGPRARRSRRRAAGHGAAERGVSELGQSLGQPGPGTSGSSGSCAISASISACSRVTQRQLPCHSSCPSGS